MTSRYGIDPSRLKGQKDVVEYLKDILDRVSAEETGLQIGNTSIEDGNLVVRNGDIIVSESDGNIVLRVLHGAVPEIRFFPLGDTDNYQAALLGYDFDVGSGNDQAVQLSIERSTDLVQDGGKLLLSRLYAILSHQPASGDESYIWLNADGGTAGVGTPQIFLFRGRWSDQFQYDTQMGLYMGSFSFGSGFSNFTHTYAASFATTICPVVGFMNSVDTAVAWSITAQSTSSFKVRWATGTDGKTINFWNFRI